MKCRARLWGVLIATGLAYVYLHLTLPHTFAQTPEVGHSTPAGQMTAQESLRGGWMDFTPFQISERGTMEGPQGLDVDMLAEIMGLAHIEARLYKQTWLSQLQDLIDGRSDIALGAFLPAEGDDRFHYSLPYRVARVSLFVRAEDKDTYKGADVTKLVSENVRFRIGAVPGRLFPETELNRAIMRAAREGRVVYAESDEENLRNLVDGRIDGFVGDRLGVSAAALDAGLKFRAAEIPMPGTASVHLLFSKKTVSAETVARVNAAITALQEEGQLTKLLHNRIFAVVMGYALSSTALFILGIVGTVTFAISGVLIAYRENFSLFGALVLSALPAVGGGVFRDVLFDRHPIGVMASPFDLCLVGATVLVSFLIIVAMQTTGLLNQRKSQPAKRSGLVTMANVQEVCDAAGLAAFTASGLAVAISVGADPLWLWGPISAMLTAAGGGILRDIVRQSGKVSTLKDDFYAEIPLLWGFAFSVFLLTRPALLAPEDIGIGIIVTVIGTFLTRLLVVFLGVKALPFHWRAK